MIDRRSVLALFVLCWLGMEAKGAPLRFVPQTLIQPNGDTIRVFASGDEYNHWLHDKDEFTIIQDPVTGYYTYAVRSKTGTGVVASKFIVGTSDPIQAGLERRVYVLPDALGKTRSAKISRVNKSNRVDTLWRGRINNIAMFIRFSDDSEFTSPFSKFDDLLNSRASGALSFSNYYDEVSYHQLAVSTTFYPTPINNVIRSYQDAHPRGYFQPYNAVTNPIGYSIEPGNYESFDRELALLKNAIQFINSDIPSSLNIDADNDGVVDNIMFIIKGSPDGWGGLLWPHLWYLGDGMASINNKKVSAYSIEIENYTNVSTLAHEFYHVLGAPDLYRYLTLTSINVLSPVGPWDIMGGGGDIPSHMGAYMKNLYGRWIPEIPEITHTGTYTLSSVGTSKNSCYKIRSKKSAADYYIVEVRRKEGNYESTLPGEGLLVYRIHGPLEGKGDSNGPPDEVYLYRAGGTISSDGNLKAAAMSLEAGRTSLNSWSSDPIVILSDSSKGDLVITDVSHVGETMSFKVWMTEDELFGGSVDKLSGTTSDAFKFTVCYRSNTQPNSVVLNCNGKTYDMIQGATNWNDSVKFSRTMIFPEPGRYSFFFSAVVNGAVLRYPAGTDSLKVDVAQSSFRSDIAATVLTASKSLLMPGDAFSATAVIHNTNGASNKTVVNIPYTFTLYDPLMRVVDERSGTVASLAPGSALVISSGAEFVAPATEGNYTIMFSTFPVEDENTANNSISRSFYVGSSVAKNQYYIASVNGRIPMDSVVSSTIIDGAQWLWKDANTDSIILQRSGVPPFAIGLKDFYWYDDQRKIAMCDDITGRRAVVSFGTQQAVPFVSVDKQSVTCLLGQNVQFTAVCHGLRFNREYPQLYKNSTLAAWPFQIQYSPGDTAAKFIMTVPQNAPPGSHQFFVSWAVDSGNARIVQGLQLFVRGIWTDAEPRPGANPGGPISYQLAQNFPNPFNPTTTIEFALPQQSRVSVRVYDVLGREAAVLVDDDMAAGVHSIPFDASMLPSGMYFYRLRAQHGETVYHETKRCVLLK